MNYAVALGVYSVRYPAVFWSCNKPLATIFSFQLIVNSAQSLLAYVGMSVLYKASCKHNLFPLRIFFLSFRSLNQEICFDLFSGPSNGAFEGATSSSSTVSYDINHKQHIDHFRGLVLFAESTCYARSVRSLLPFGALLKHGDVFLRLRQVSCLLSFSSIPFHSVPFRSIPFRSIPFRSIPFHSIPFHSVPFRSIPFCSVHFFIVRKINKACNRSIHFII